LRGCGGFGTLAGARSSTTGTWCCEPVVEPGEPHGLTERRWISRASASEPVPKPPEVRRAATKGTGHCPARVRGVRDARWRSLLNHRYVVLCAGSTPLPV